MKIVTRDQYISFITEHTGQLKDVLDKGANHNIVKHVDAAGRLQAYAVYKKGGSVRYATA